MLDPAATNKENLQARAFYLPLLQSVVYLRFYIICRLSPEVLLLYTKKHRTPKRPVLSLITVSYTHLQIAAYRNKD